MNEKQRYQELADFLKTRRAKILPSQVGLPEGTRRRTPGLRREEVAQLAGIGITWYTWLEQGRPIHVSAQVIESLARALLLDAQERNHLYRLANQPLPADIPQYRGSVSPILTHVLDRLVFCPSMITDQRWNVLAWNEAARLIFGDFCSMSARQRNIVWSMFTEKYFKELYDAGWTVYAKSLLGRFRSACGKYIEDPWLTRFVDDLKGQSEEFNAWWPLYEIQDDSGVYKHMRHPDAGTLDFESSSFDVPDTGCRMFVHIPRPGTDTEEKMKAMLNGVSVG